MMRVFVLFLVFVLAVPAHAQTIRSSPSSCAANPNYSPVPSVNYVPGTGGVTDPDIRAFDPNARLLMEMPFELDLEERFPDVTFPEALSSDIKVGFLMIFEDGRMEYDGKIINAIKSAGSNAQGCAQCSSCNASVLESSKADRQEEPDPVKSEPELIEIREGIEGEVLEGQYP